MMKNRLNTSFGSLKSCGLINWARFLWVVSFAAVFAGSSFLVGPVAFAGGSIVINASAPASELVYREDSGATKALKVTWTDIQVIDAMRRFMTGKFGAAGADQPFYINRKASKVSYFDPTTETYSEVGFRELLGNR